MPIIENHKSLIIPKDNTILWRYMDIPAFLSMLTSNSLTFVRANLFEKYEGTLPKNNAKLLEYYINSQSNKEILNYDVVENANRNQFYLNCWCKENHLMVHMWKIYSKEHGIAIETTYDKLKCSILSEKLIFPTEINYIDRIKDIISLEVESSLISFTVKAKEYKAESEFRLIMPYPLHLRDESGLVLADEVFDENKKRLYSETPVIKCNVNLSKLISIIHISPYAPKWYREFIFEVTKKYELEDVPIGQAEL